MNPTHAEYGLIAALMAASGIHGLVDEGDPIRLTRTTPEEYEARAPGHYLPGDNLCLWGKRRIVIWETAPSGRAGHLSTAVIGETPVPVIFLHEGPVQEDCQP